MNGIGLLVLIAAAGQLGAAGPMTQNRDFGWEIDTRSEDRALCYIVQLSPQKVKEMQDTGWEYPSDMPAELVGRATRIVFRIGTNLLPQTPSLEEIKRMPRFNSQADVTAQLGPGRISDVETGSLYNVQQDQRAPALPSFGGGTGLTPLDPATNLADQAQQNANALSDNLRNFVRGTDPRFGAATAGTANSDSVPPMPGFPGTTAPSRFDNSTAPLNTPDNRFSSGTNPIPSGVNTGQAPNYGAGTYNSTEAYDPRDPAALGRGMFNAIPSRQTPAGGFGNYGTNNPSNFASTNPAQAGSPQSGASQMGTSQMGTGQMGTGQMGSNAAPLDYSGGQNPGYNQSPYNPSPYIQGHLNPSGQFNNTQFANGTGYGNDGRSLIASTAIPATGLPNTNAPATSGGAVSTTNTPPGTPATNPNTDSPSRKSAAADNILPVFFLLSLVVNVYLGMLIRKLLTRYRALLANRGQSTSGAYS